MHPVAAGNIRRELVLAGLSVRFGSRKGTSSRWLHCGAGMKGRRNSPTSGIVRHDSHMRKSGDPAGDRTRLALVGGERANRSANCALSFAVWDAGDIFLMASPENRCIELRNLMDMNERWLVAETIVNTDTRLWEPDQKAISTLASHQGEPGSIPDRITGFSQVGIVPDDAVGRRVFSGISRFPHPPPHTAISKPASHRGEPGSLAGRVIGFSQVGIMPDDAVGRRVFSVFSRFPRSLHSGAVPYSLRSPSSALKNLDVTSRPNLFTLVLQIRNCFVIATNKLQDLFREFIGVQEEDHQTIGAKTYAGLLELTAAENRPRPFYLEKTTEILPEFLSLRGHIIS
ncbi:hypothetical protein PR048_033583 [Dryococelus australis]|uniref:Uncharacterized protein n=1 Tax=Dryococelus australis TaxID=614101 RepID=A0ABQ9G0P9_9NEOP|nr:hypothetical protein PR048_033583 [Dryococelus australis]